MPGSFSGLARSIAHIHRFAPKLFNWICSQLIIAKPMALLFSNDASTMTARLVKYPDILPQNPLVPQGFLLHDLIA